MKVRIAALCLLAVGVVVGVLLFQEGQPDDGIEIHLTSDPFPLSLGKNTLFVSLTGADGEAVTDASVGVTAQMVHQGMLPLSGRAAAVGDGVYSVPIIWSMAGQWVVNIAAQRPGDSAITQDQFEVFVFATTASGVFTHNDFRSVRQNQSVLRDPAREMLIFIPQGTQVMIREGQMADIIPEEINLSVGGRNTLIIQNDDIVNHTIGPYYVRAGETIRQTFTEPAVYIGTCSLRYSAELNIVVEA